MLLVLALDNIGVYEQALGVHHFSTTIYVTVQHNTTPYPGCAVYHPASLACFKKKARIY